MKEKQFLMKLNEKFTPTSPAIDNYVRRPNVDRDFRKALFEQGLQIIVYGPTGVGKSSLVWSKLENERIPYIRFGFDAMVNEENFCPKIMNALGFEKFVQRQDGTESGTGAEISAGAKIWQLISFKGKFKANSKVTNQQITIPYYSDADIDAVANALEETGCVLFLDDVEKADDKLKKLIAHLGKKLSDNSVVGSTNAKIIYAGVSQEVRKLIEVDSSLRDRLSDQLITQAEGDEIKEIMIQGWRHVNLTWNDQELENVVKLCCGYPRYAHWIGKEAAMHAFENGRSNITQDDIDEAINFVIRSYRDAYQTKFDRATGHKSGLRLREHILYSMALSDDIEVRFDFILDTCSKLTKVNLKQTQLSGPLGELKKDARGSVLEDGRNVGLHRFSDLMFKPFIRMIMKQNNISG